MENIQLKLRQNKPQVNETISSCFPQVWTELGLRRQRGDESRGLVGELRGVVRGLFLGVGVVQGGARSRLGPRVARPPGPDGPSLPDRSLRPGDDRLLGLVISEENGE